MHNDRLTLFTLSYSFPLVKIFYPIPGIILMKLFKDPNFKTV